MKKILATLLAFVLLLSLCACGSSEPIRGEQIDHNKDSDSSVTEPDAEEETDEIEETEDSEVNEDTENTEDSKEGLVLGETSGLTYESEFIGIGCTLPEGWIFYSDEQIMELNNIAIGASGEELQSLLENATVIYDMYASDATGVNNMNVNMEKVNALQLIGLDLAQNYENTIPLIKTSFENMGCSDVQCEVGTVTIDDEEFTCMYNTIDFSGIVLYQCLIAIKCDGYLANVSITAADEATLADILSCLYVL